MDGLSIEFTQGSPRMLRVAGELDIATAEKLRVALEQAMDADPAVVVNMNDVTFIDVTGVRVILDAAGSTNGNGPLKLVNAPRVAWLLDLMGLDAHAVSLDFCDGR